MSKGKTIAKRVFGVLGLVILAGVALAGGVFLKVLQKKDGEFTGGGHKSLWQSVEDARQIAISPKEGFPGKDRLIILCMGIDDNWTDKDMVYTTGSRTDTLFLLSLDLVNKKAAMLSIPRDTYAHIAGTRGRYFKINEAYSTGGPDRAIDTVQELLGVHADHFMVLNIDATKKMVDALGGVDVTVEHEMHRHDHWGHFSVDLLPGTQHLNGEQAVGFARYREPDAGKKATPEDGDVRRTYRQHVLLKAMIGRAKSFANVTQAPQLIDVGMSTIRTDLTRTQLFDLAAIFRGIQPEGVQTATLPGDDYRGPNGEWFYKIDKDKAVAYTDWLIRGDDTAARKLVTVVVKNGTNRPGLAQRVVEALKTNGYTDVQNGGNAPRPVVRMTAAPTTTLGLPRTSLLDTGVPFTGASQDVATLLGLSDATIVRQPVKPNHLGWTPPTTLTLTLGKDYALAVAQADKVTGDVEDPSAPPTVKQN